MRITFNNHCRGKGGRGTPPHTGYRYKEPSFTGKHNRVKLAAFTAILVWRFDPSRVGIQPHELADILGDITTLASLRVLLARWTSWGYIVRYPLNGKYHYQVTPEGKAYINKHAGNIDAKDIARKVRQYHHEHPE